MRDSRRRRSPWINRRTDEAAALLGWNGGGAHGSGTGIGNIDTQGNVKQRSFSQIWSDTMNKKLAALRSHNGRLEGRYAGCRFLGICVGGF